MSEPLVPVSTTIASDTVADGLDELALGRKKIPDDNFGADPGTVDFINQFIFPLLFRVRQDRLPLEEIWRAGDNMEMLKHDSGRKYMGRTDTYVPMFNRTLTTMTSQIIQGLFPSDEYMDVSARSPQDDEKAKGNKSYLQWEFEHVAHLRQNLKPGIRQELKYGTTALKFWYEPGARKVGKPKLQKLISGDSRPDGMQFADEYCSGLRVSARNMYHLFVYPMTAQNLDEALMVFEDIEVPRSFIESQSKRWINTEDALMSDGRSSDQGSFDSSQREELDNYAEGAGQPKDETDFNSPHALRVITEIWVRLPVPSRYRVGDEKPGDMIPCRVVMAGDIILEVRRNTEWHQQMPYLFGRCNARPGFFYGDGMARLNQGFQYLVNDILAQVNDCGIYSLNPMVAMNPGNMVGTVPKIRPGAVWKMTDPNAINFLRPPIELAQYGMQMVMALRGMAEDYGGAPPVLQGSKGAKTATATSILQRNAAGPLEDIVEDLELDIMVPLMKCTRSMGQQYREPEILLRVAGEDIRIKREDLAIDADCMWLASSQAANQAQRSQQLMQVLQIASAPGLLQLVQAQNKTINPIPLLTRLMTDGFGLRGVDQIIPPFTPPPMPGGPGMLPPGGPPQPDATGDRVRSPTEQVGGEGTNPEPGPGETEDFMGTRMGADDMAGAMGGMGAYGGGGE